MSDFLDRWALESEKNKKLISREQLIFDITEDLLIVMEDKNISKADLARKIGKSRSYVTQILSGARNMTLRTLSDIAFALDIYPSIQLFSENHILLNGNHDSYDWNSSSFEINDILNSVVNLKSKEEPKTFELRIESEDLREYAA